MELAEQSQAVRRLLEILPEEKQQVLRLVYELEMSIRGTASELGLSEGIVKYRLHCARRRLRNELRNQTFSFTGE